MRSRNHLILVLTLLNMSCSNSFSNQDTSELDAQFTTKIQKFSNCEDMTRLMRSAQDLHVAVSPGILETPVISSDQIYDTQSPNVLEGDHVQVNEKNIFVLRTDGLEILDRASLTRMKMVPLENSFTRTMFVVKNQIVVLSSNYQNETQIYWIDASNFNIIQKKNILGVYNDARIHNDRFIIMTSVFNGVSSLTSTDSVLSPQCSEIYQAQVNAYSNMVTLLFNFNLGDPTQMPSMTGFTGYPNLLYMTENSLYLFSNSFYQFPSHLQKITWNANSIEMSSVGTFSGHIKDRWAVNEFKDQNETYIAFASGILGADLWNTEYNKISILKENHSTFVLTGESESFGYNETIRSVRFIDNLAYVVTFRTIDPLFIFDLKNRYEVKKLGELKVPGFSTHLRPVSESHILGFGFDTAESNGGSVLNGLQISLFDISKKELPKRSYVASIGSPYSYSPAISDPHSLMYDADSGLIAIPFHDYNSSDSSGADVFKYTTPSRLEKIGYISHNTWRQNSLCGQPTLGSNSSVAIYTDIDRVIVLDNRLISVSSMGIKAHDPTTLKVLTEYRFKSNPPDLCVPAKNNPLTPGD